MHLVIDVQLVNRLATPQPQIITSWSILGLGVEIGLTFNIMKSINIFNVDVIKDFSYNYDIIIQVQWKKGNKKKNLYFESVWNDATWHSKILECILSL
jgi:hypothetical protein